jgi:hypothetical protein
VRGFGFEKTVPKLEETKQRTGFTVALNHRGCWRSKNLEALQSRDRLFFHLKDVQSVKFPFLPIPIDL